MQPRMGRIGRGISDLSGLPPLLSESLSADGATEFLVQPRRDERESVGAAPVGAEHCEKLDQSFTA